MKRFENLLCYVWIFDVKLHVHLKKWTLKFKLLYLRNYIRYFNKICSICCVNTRIQSLNVWLKSVLSWLKYSIFSKGLFFIGTPCTSRAHATTSVSVCLWRKCIGSRCMPGTQRLRQPAKLKPSYDPKQTWPPPMEGSSCAMLSTARPSCNASVNFAIIHAVPNASVTNEGE